MKFYKIFFSSLLFVALILIVNFCCRENRPSTHTYNVREFLRQSNWQDSNLNLGEFLETNGRVIFSEKDKYFYAQDNGIVVISARSKVHDQMKEIGILIEESNESHQGVETEINDDPFGSTRLSGDDFHPED